MEIEVWAHALEDARAIEHRGSEPGRVGTRSHDGDVAFVPIALEERPGLRGRVRESHGYCASAERMRTQLRMPLWNEVRSYFSLGEWMRSSSRPKPISRVSMPSMRLTSATIGIEAPDPMRAASRPHSSVSARRAAASGGMPQSSAIAGAPAWLMKSARQSAGSRARTKFRNASRMRSGSWSLTSRNDTLAELLAGITVFDPSPV